MPNTTTRIQQPTTDNKNTAQVTCHTCHKTQRQKRLGGMGTQACRACEGGPSCSSSLTKDWKLRPQVFSHFAKVRPSFLPGGAGRAFGTLSCLVQLFLYRDLHRICIYPQSLPSGFLTVFCPQDTWITHTMEQSTNAVVCPFNPNMI